jgi:hypothetical protein
LRNGSETRKGILGEDMRIIEFGSVVLEGDMDELMVSGTIKWTYLRE